MKKYNFVYKTTNLINKKIYIGVHSTDKLDDGYLGSGKYLAKAIEKYGIYNFEREIIKYFDNIENAYLFESEVVNEEFVNRQDTYNLTTGGHGGYNNISEQGKENISKARKNMVTAINEFGDKVCVTKEIFDKSENLKGNTYGTTTVRDENGNCFQVPKEEAHKYDKPSTGLVVAIDLRKNERVTITKEDFDKFDYYVGNTYGSKQTEESNLKRSQAQKGKPKPTKKFFTCEYCGKTMNGGNYSRWHGDNCKFKQ